MTQVLERNSDRYFIHQNVTWEQFKTLQVTFEQISGVRLMFCEGTLEIMGVGLLHETICALMGILLGQYFIMKRLNFIATGAYSQIVESQAEFQADLSYSFNGNKEVTDLCIEIVVTSGNTKKLKKYQLRNIPEVWFWQDGKIAIFRLQEGDYIQQEKSAWLPDLDIAHLEECLLMDSHLEAVLAFQSRYEA